MNEIETPDEVVEPKAKCCRELVEEHKNDPEAKKFPLGTRLVFDVDADIKAITAPFKKNVNLSESTIAASLKITNPTKPIIIGGQPHVLSRVQLDQSNYCTVMFELGKDGKYYIDPAEPILPLQDPFYCGQIEGYHIFGGVATYPQKGTRDLGYKTVFYRYKNDPSELYGEGGRPVEPFAEGPPKMKDIRLIQLDDGGIGVFTRPQKDQGYGGRGKIGYFRIDSLEQLSGELDRHVTEEKLDELIDGLFIDDEWGGANELHRLNNGLIGVIGHIACQEKRPKPDNPNFCIKNYYAVAFVFNPKDRSISRMKVIVTADDFAEKVEPDEEDLGSIVFSGGIISHGDGTATWYGGLADKEAGQKLIADPFAGLWPDEKA